MEKVTIKDIEPQSPPDENIPNGAMASSIGDARLLSEPLGTIGLAINYYELDPGESFAHSSHRHSNQEEVFYIQSGTVTFETETGKITVTAGEILHIPPGTFQFGINHGDEQVTAITLGAPREYEENTQYLIDCDECGERTTQVFERLEEQNEFITRCTDCDTETHRISY
ncbi:cupin domain-containing protein [Halocatena pleomorpha]|uniref:Cupin domain-containing protein n=1 Tax=Halocatena pleomorpha TaxID=1785090 RepID=A0A3P3R967_9EURY|nr:cupin domain-containing protein [Halocatena pleomorpha]RRJ29956.1 cupin domain-containing protein [Halocatena pleomorpha]